MNETFSEIDLLAPGRLNYHHLHYFWAVAKEGHLTRAAERLHVSQSALSAQIRRLEDQLGEALFERVGRRLRLTDAGRLVMDYAESIFTLGAELLDTVRHPEQAAVQRLRIGSVPTLSRNFQENLLRPLLRRGDLSLVLESAPLEELLSRLAVYRLDVVLSNRLPAADAERAWRFRRIAHQPVSLVGPARDAERAFRFPADLDGRTVVLPGASSDIRARFDAICEEHGVTVHIGAEVDDMAMLRLIARDSGALALLPAVVVQDELQSGSLTELFQLRDIEENFYAITVPRRFEPPALQQLLQRPMGKILAGDGNDA
jgi:LysR family transcriptional activator of nhaA